MQQKRIVGGAALAALLVLAFAWAAVNPITYLPLISNMPTPTATFTPVPVATPIPVYGNCNSTLALNIQCNFFYLKSGTVAAGQYVWFHFKVTHLTNDVIYVSGVGALWMQNGTRLGVQASWGPEHPFPATVDTEDHLGPISTPGTYQVYLAVCTKQPPDSASVRCTNDLNAWTLISDAAQLIIN